MSTAIRANRRRLGGENFPTNFQLPIEHYRQMQAIAEYKRWPVSETLRQAVIFYLRENRDLLQVISPPESGNGHPRD